jgi:hypothetical protein
MAAELRSWQVAMGLVPALPLAVGLSLAMAGPTFFWPGIALAYAATAWAAGTWYLLSRTFPSRQKGWGYALPCAFVVLISWVAFRPAPMEIMATAEDRHYFKDAAIAGIKWQDHYYDMRMFITNKSGAVYSNLKLLIRTDLYIKEVGVINKFSQCTSDIVMPFRNAAITITGIDKDHPLTIPLFSMNANTSATVFKTVCDRLLDGDTLELVIPIVAHDIQRRFSLPRTKPAWVASKISYEAFGRSRSTVFDQCFLPSCDNIVLPIEF